MAVNLIIEEIIQDCIFRARNEDNWNDYKMVIMINIHFIDLEKKIEKVKIRYYKIKYYKSTS